MACWSHRDPVTRATRGTASRLFATAGTMAFRCSGCASAIRRSAKPSERRSTAHRSCLHGRSSLVEHQGVGVFAGVSNPLVVGRYHSLVVEDAGLPAEFEVTARSHGLIMGMRHRTLPLEGVQFHPESVLTQDGYLMLANWLEECGSTDARERPRHSRFEWIRCAPLCRSRHAERELFDEWRLESGARIVLDSVS